MVHAAEKKIMENKQVVTLCHSFCTIQTYHIHFLMKFCTHWVPFHGSVLDFLTCFREQRNDFLNCSIIENETLVSQVTCKSKQLFCLIYWNGYTFHYWNALHYLQKKFKETFFSQLGKHVHCLLGQKINFPHGVHN